MKHYYATVAQIRYYGQVPKTVGKAAEAVWGTGVESTLFGENVLTRAAWTDFLEAAREQPFDLSRRKEPVHERLANMTLDVDSIYVFTKAWGFLDAEVAPDGRLVTQPQHLEQFQDLLQRAWKGESKALSEIEKDVKARVDVGAKGIDIAVVDLWNLVRLSFLRDHKVGRTKVCANKDCPSPYFLEQRKGQKYCTHKCAVLMNVRRFRERQAKTKSHPKRRARR
jgi:hypothetical protein